MSLWESTDSFVKADFDMGFNQGLIQGQRLALKKDSLGSNPTIKIVRTCPFLPQSLTAFSKAVL